MTQNNDTKAVSAIHRNFWNSIPYCSFGCDDCGMHFCDTDADKKK